MFRFLAALSLLVLALPNEAHACAGFYHDSSVFAESNYQEAIFRKVSAGVQVDYKVNLEVSTPSFGWVIPVPGAVSKVEDGDNAEFEALFEGTAPEFDLAETESGGCGARALKGDANLGDSASAGGVTVIYSGATPTYTYDVLQADSSAALESWLGDNGWSLGNTSASIEAYVTEGGYQFVAVKLGLDLEDGEAVEASLPPLRLTYDGDRMEFPSRMAQYGDVEHLDTIIYVIGDGRAHVSGWGEEELPLVWDDGEDPDYMRYTAWPEAVDNAGSNGAFAVTWSGAWEGGWVTRFDTSAERTMHTVDAVFTLSDEKTELHTLVSNQGGCNTPDGAALMLLPLLGLLRRRQDGPDPR